jgi:hypothetical protein
MAVGRRLGLRPGNGTSSHPCEWSRGRKRAWLELHPADRNLPDIALDDHWNDLTSSCTPSLADIRLLADVHVSVIELLSVRSDWFLSLQDSSAKLTLCSIFPSISSGARLGYAFVTRAGLPRRSANTL